MLKRCQTLNLTKGAGATPGAPQPSVESQKRKTNTWMSGRDGNKVLTPAAGISAHSQMDDMLAALLARRERPARMTKLVARFQCWGHAETNRLALSTHSFGCRH
jgi:hypothetical protein